MKEYTNEEYKILWEMTKGFGVSNYFLELHITDKTLSIGSAAVFKDIQEAIKVSSGKAYDMMYELPFEEIPLQLGAKSPLINAIIKWRLTIGK